MNSIYNYIRYYFGVLGREYCEILDIYYSYFHYIDSDGILVISQDMVNEYAFAGLDWRIINRVLRSVSGCEYYKINGLHVKGVRFFF